MYAVELGGDSPCAMEADAPCRNDVKTNRTGCSKWNQKLSTDEIKCAHPALLTPALLGRHRRGNLTAWGVVVWFLCRAGPTLDTSTNTLYVTTSGDQSLNGTLFGLSMDAGARATLVAPPARPHTLTPAL